MPQFWQTFAHLLYVFFIVSKHRSIYLNSCLNSCCLGIGYWHAQSTGWRSVTSRKRKVLVLFSSHSWMHKYWSVTDRGFCTWDICMCHSLCELFYFINTWESGGGLILGNVLKSFSGTAFFLGSGQTVIKQLPHTTIWQLLDIRQLLLTWIGRKEARPYSDMIFRGQIWVKNQLKFDLPFLKDP